MENKSCGSRVNATSCDACRCEWYLVRVDFTARPEGNINADEKSRNNNKRADREEKKKERKQGSEMLSGPKPQIKI